MEPKVVRITIEYEDQSEFFAEGEAANEIWKWWQSTESLAFVHGAKFGGERLQYKPAPAFIPAVENSKEKG